MSQVSLGRPEFVPWTPLGHPTAKFLYVIFLCRFFCLHTAGLGIWAQKRLYSEVEKEVIQPRLSSDLFCRSLSSQRQHKPRDVNSGAQKNMNLQPEFLLESPSRAGDVAY